ncbi:MAG: putative quinol monooxygenase [Pseudomonadota bacterium]
MSKPVYVMAVLTAKPGRRAEILSAFAENLPAVLAEDGCVTYVPAIDHPGSTAPQGDDVIVVVEEWSSADHLEAHRTAPHMVAFGERVGPLLANRAIHVLEAP